MRAHSYLAVRRARFLKTVRTAELSCRRRRRLVIFRTKTGAGHSAFYIFVLHELVPHETRTIVFSHQHGDSQVEAEHIGIVPIRQGIEGVAETVLRPHLFAIRAANMTQHADAILKEKRQGAAGRARNYTAVHRTKRAAIHRGTAPRGVALDVIRRADAPKIFAVIGKPIAERKAEKLMRFSGFDRIFKIVGVSVAFVA